MENKANFLLIGAFALAGLGAMLGAFLWLGAFRVERDVARYGILFEDVSGLSQSGQVVFNGLAVGRVFDLRLHDADPSLIHVTIEIDAATPVRSDTVAQLTVQGVTGVAYIALIGGTPGAGPLPDSDAGSLPLIPSRRTGLQSLMTDVPGLVEEVRGLVADLRAMSGPETRARVASILANTDAATGKLDATLDGLGGLTTGLADAAEQIGGLGRTAATLEGDIRGTLGLADAALDSVAEGFDAAGPAIEDLRQTAAVLRSFVSEDGAATLAGWRSAGAQLGPVLTRADATFEAIAAASTSVGTLASGDAAAVLAETREAVAVAAPALRNFGATTLPEYGRLASDARALVQSFSRFLRRIEQDPVGALQGGRVPEYRR